ncbi:MAG: M20 family metallo-hydrolase [Chloroflexi bacterium]|nr:M20 family metallo-hydrolase [Chloroflexota bacterium]
MSESRASGDRFAVELDPAMLQRHIDELGAIGALAEGGLYRGVYTPAWAEAMALVQGWLEALGLETRRDAVGNLFGRLPGTESQRAVLSGSHIDTVRQGGKYDGALGIHAAIAAIGALKAAYGRPRKHLEVYVICEEEGSRFHASFWGSRALNGRIAPHEADSLQDADGVAIGQAMRERGLDSSAIPSAKRDDVDAFIELHIEQGRILDDEGYDAGVVHTITGLRQLRVRVGGRQDHAGTTPMDLRRDALAGAVEMIARLTGAAEAMGRPAVATVGSIAVAPGATNVVPASCTFTIDTRHSDPGKRLELLAAIERHLQEVAARRGLELEVQQLIEHHPVPMTPAIRDLVEACAQAEGLRYLSMPSGAGHDSQIMAQHVPTGMVFVPSVDGRSHTPAEYTPVERSVPGVRVLARALYRLAY